MTTQTSFTQNANSNINLGDVKNIDVKNFIELHKNSTIKEYTVMSVSLGAANIMIKVDSGFACVDGFYPNTLSNVLTDNGYTKIV